MSYYEISWNIIALLIFTSLSIFLILTMYNTTEIIIKIPPKYQSTGDPNIQSFIWLPIVIGLLSIISILFYYSSFVRFSPIFKFYCWIFGFILYILSVFIFYFIGRSLIRPESPSSQSKISPTQTIIGLLSSFVPFIIFAFGGLSIIGGIMGGQSQSPINDFPNQEFIAISLLSGPIISGLYTPFIFGKLSS
jgi:hypothetical protein